MKLKLACADFTFPLLPHEHALDLIARMGFNGVDIGLFERRGHLWPSNELKHAARSARALRRRLADRGLKLADLFLQTAPDFASLAPNHPDPRVRRRARDVFARAVDYTVAAGGRHITALPGVRWENESLGTSLQRCADELAWRCDTARRAGVTFAVEAHLGSIVPTPALARRLLQRTPGLTLTLDYGHFIYQGFRNTEIEPLVAYASHFHARCGRRRRLQSAFPVNAIDFARALRRMKRTGYRGWITVEYVWVDWEHCNEVDNVSETIRLRDFLRRTFRA